MSNLQLATLLPTQVIVRGENHIVSYHVHQVGGNNFNWSGYTPVAKLVVGSVSVTGTSAVVSQGGGTATATFTAAQTATLPANSWGTLILYADPSANSENLHIANVYVRTSFEAIP
jgi:hypothetical protein